MNCGAEVLFGQDPQFDTSTDGLPRLSPNSPAVDAGDTDNAATPTDYDGLARIEGAQVDLGAFELGGGPLPVELIAFTARSAESHIALAWRTAAEIDLAGYRLERSADGVDFAKVTFANALGLGDYAFADRDVVAGMTYYYRLISVDFDGTTYTSPLVSASISGAGAGDALVQRVYPNPSRGDLRVDVDAPATRSNGPTVATLHDQLGRELRTWTLTPGATSTLDLVDFPAGQYFLRVVQGERTQTERIVLER